MRKSKIKYRPNYQNVILKMLFTIISIPIVIGGLCYGFAQFGGEVASANVIPIYQESTYIDAEFLDGYRYRYVTKRSILVTELSPEFLREWFDSNGIYLSPFLTIGYKNHGTEPYEYTIEYEGYYGTHGYFAISNNLQRLHSFSASIFGSFDEMVRSCQSVRVYFDNEVFAQDFPGVEADYSKTLYVVSTCWLRVD